jgi:hypothetical protein
VTLARDSILAVTPELQLSCAARLTCESVAQPRSVIRCLSVRFVAQARPEETAQAVALCPRHNMKMQMWDALADDIVCRHERALAAQRGRHDGANPLHPKKERADSRSGQIRQAYHVLTGSHQDMTLEHWPAIQERHDFFVGEHDVRRHQAGPDVTEQAVAPCAGAFRIGAAGTGAADTGADGTGADGTGADGTTLLLGGFPVRTDDSLPEWQLTDDGTFWQSAASLRPPRKAISFPF